jgi:predicted dinucleotide-binding enzyme
MSQEVAMQTPSERNATRRQFLLAAGAAAAAIVLGTWPVPKRLSAGKRRALKIGIIGSGNMGGGLGLLWARAGHEILFSSRNPGELSELVARAGRNARAGYPQQAAEFGEVVLIAVPYGALPQIGRDHGALLRGKVVIDCGNPRADRDGPMADDALARGTGIASAEYLPGARLVRAFNAIAATMLDARREGERIGVPLAGDDPAAVALVAGLIEDAGFDPVVVGGLAEARRFDRGTPVYVRGMTARQLREALELPE